MLKTFYSEKTDKNDIFILYGAAMYGELAYYALLEVGIKATYFCDRVQAGEMFCGLPVISPQELKKISNASVLICATKGFEGIKNYLEELEWHKYYEISQLLKYLNYSKLKPYCKQLSVDELISKYEFYSKEKIDDEKLNLSFVALSITERCTLKCKKCSVLAPYYTNPCDDKVESIIKPLGRLLQCVDGISELQVGGGEPFMHKELNTILQWCINQDKIKEISIFTNSTIVPNDKLVETLKNQKIKLLLDDYEGLSKNLGKIIALANQNKIRYVVQKFARWDDLGDYKEKGYTEEEVEKIFKHCSFGNVMSFMKGKLYRCTTAARIADLGYVADDSDDYVDFRNDNISNEILKNKIRELIKNKKYHLGCKHCNGISTNKMGIPVAEQL